MPTRRPSRRTTRRPSRPSPAELRQGELFPLSLTAYSTARRVEELAAKTRREARLVAQLDRIATPGEWDTLDARPVLERDEVDALLTGLPEALDAAGDPAAVEDAYALADRQLGLMSAN